MVNASGRLRAGSASVALDGGRHGRALAADECACALVYLELKGLAGAEDVLADKAVLLCLSYRLCQSLDRMGVLGTDIDAAVFRARCYTGDYHALYHLVGDALHNGAIHECARVALVAVADDIFFARLLMRCDLRPLFARGEAGAAATPEAGVGNFAYDLIAGHVKQRLFKRRIAADGNVLVDALGIYLAAVLQCDMELIFIKRDILLLRVCNIVTGVKQSLDNSAVCDGLVYDILAVLGLYLAVEIALGLYLHERAYLTKALAAAFLYADAVAVVDMILKADLRFKSLVGQHGLELFIYAERAAGYTAGACAHEYLMLLRRKRLGGL